MILGVDPGASGAITGRSDTRLIFSYKMPKTDEILIELIKTIKEKYGSDPNKKNICFLEKVSGFTGFKDKVIECPGCHKKIVYQAGDPGSRMFKFGDNYASVRVAIKSQGIEVIEVTPQAWMKALGVGKAREHKDKTAWKNHLKNRAIEYYPGMNVILQTADALLILKYGILYLQNQQPF